METALGRRIWVVVYVMAGVPQTVEAYRRYPSAVRAAKRMRADMHPQNDEVAIFRAPVVGGW